MGLSSILAPGSIAKPGVCTSSTRPASPYEGQVIYTTDTDLLQIWNGTAWRTLAFGTPTNGTVLQVVRGTKTGGVTNNTTSFATTGLSASITPTSTTSKILVTVAQNWLTGTSTVCEMQLRRSGTTVDTFGHMLLNDSNVTIGYSCTTSLDSPSSTSSLTYETFFRRVTGAGACIANYSDPNGTGLSTIVLMEVAG